MMCRRASSAICARFLLAFALCIPTAGGQDTEGPDNNAALAERHPNDRGIAHDPAVIFSDDFEAWANDGTTPPSNTWQVRQNSVSRTHVIAGQIQSDAYSGPGAGVLEIACWTEGNGSQTGGLSLKLGNYNHVREGLGDGYDEVYVRYDIRFDEDYRAVQNHGANLGGRDLTMPNAAWVGMAGIRDVSTRGYFYSGVQPRGESGSRELEMGFYSYHLDKRGPWGENYEVLKHIPVHVGRWYCVERHLKLNSVDPSHPDPAIADGVEELWIDGQVSIQKRDVRFRRVPHLKITLLSLETYYHGLPEQYGRDHPIRVCFDNVVVARQYIGPLTSAASEREMP